LDGTVRNKLEKSFGVDLSPLTVHTGPGADAKCEKRGAVAFIRGTDIFVSSKVGSPGDKGYEKALAHEVAHYVQQLGGGKKAAGGKGKGKGNKEDKEQKEAPSREGKSGLEEDADQAATQAASGAPAAVQGAAPMGSTHNLDEGRHEEGEDHDNPTTLHIPLGGGRSIAIQPPDVSGDWSVGVAGAYRFTKGIEEKKTKWWRKNIPTPFFGLSAQVGAGFEGSIKLGEVMLKSIKVKYRKAQDTYSLKAEVETGMEFGVSAFVTAGVSANAWIAEAGVGLKAKLALTKSHLLKAGISGSYSGGPHGALHLAADLELSALELEAKAGVALYAYYDAIGVSTYCKEWTLAERVLGKLTFGGIKASVEWDSARGFDASVKPVAPQAQDFSGNISSLYPRH